MLEFIKNLTLNYSTITFATWRFQQYKLFESYVKKTSRMTLISTELSNVFCKLLSIKSYQLLKII